MNFTDKNKEVLRKEPLVDWQPDIDQNWIDLINENLRGIHLKELDDVTFPNLKIVKHKDVWQGEHVFGCEQLLFNEEVVAERFTFGDWDDMFDEELDWIVDEAKQKEVSRHVFEVYLLNNEMTLS